MIFKFTSLDADVDAVDVIDHYQVGDAHVYIVSGGRYLVKEPPLLASEYEIYKKIMENLMNSLPFIDSLRTDSEKIHHLETHIWREAEEIGQVEEISKFYERLRYYIIREVIGYGVLDVPINDDQIEEILAERFDSDIGVIHRRHSELHILDTNIVIGGSDEMNSYASRLVQKTGKSVNISKPIVDGTTRSKHRITVTFGNEVSINGPTITIRKFPARPYTITHLLRFGTISPLMAAYIWMLIDAKAFGLIVGDTGSGKTTLINSLMTMANPRWRIITIEETPELQMPHKRTVSLKTRTSPHIGSENDIGIGDLIKASLRMRPDFVIVGEIRGVEANAMFQGAATGHGGLSSVHGFDIPSALTRLAAEPINITPSQSMLLWFAIHSAKLKDRQNRSIRRIRSITEFNPDQGGITPMDLFTHDWKTDSFGTEDVEDLVKKSRRINQVSELLGIEPVHDIENRVGLLDLCIDKKAYDVQSIFDILNRYYQPSFSNPKFSGSDLDY